MSDDRGPTDPSTPESVVGELARVLLDTHLDEMVDELLDTVTTVEEVYDAQDLRDDLRESIHLNLRSVLVELASEHGPELEHPRMTARRRAEQGVPLESVLHAYGLAFRMVWNHMVKLAMQDGGPRLAALLRGGEVVWDQIDAYSAVVAVEYRSRLSQLARREERERQAMVGALVEGRVTEWEWRTSVAKVIGLRHDGPYLVVAAEPTRDEGGDGRVLDDLEQLLGRHGVRSGWTTHPGGIIGVIEADTSRTVSLVDDLLAEAAPSRIGMSQVVDSLGQVPEALVYATVARNSMGPGTRGLAHLVDRPVASLAAAAPTAVARRVADEVLGPVLDLDAEERELLLETLQAWFDHGGSTSGAASALFCHRNTVRNRLNRVAELTGRGVTDPRDVAALHASLQAHRVAPQASTGDHDP